MRSTLPSKAHNYILLSDVHLGSDLVQHTRPWTAERLRETPRIDREFGSMLDHYCTNSDPERPWRLVIAGDFIDLTGMSITAYEHEFASLTPDEREHGLGSSQDHVCAKIRAVVARHDQLFRKLASFVDSGHSLVLIRGNHDVELYWEDAQRTFLQALLERSELAEADSDARAAFAQRVEFHHWFYYERGLLYVEHGHQYDASCAYQHWLAPRSPSDPHRINYSFADILLRYVVSPTKELSPEGHDRNTLGTYLRLAVSMGGRGCMRLIYRFYKAIRRMMRSCKENLSEAAAAVREEHEFRMEQLAAVFRVDSDSLQAIQDLWATPVTARVRSIFRTLFLDGLALGLGAAIIIGALGMSGTVSWRWLGGLFAIVSLIMFRYIKRSKVMSPHAALHGRAHKLVDLMPARYVVMGHSHRPYMRALSDASTYVNLGNWALDQLDHRAPRPPCSHLVLRHDENGRALGTLFSWHRKRGATVLRSDTVLDAAPEPSALVISVELLPGLPRPETSPE